MVTWIVYDNSTKQIIAKQQSPARNPPKQPVGQTAVVIPDSDYGKYAVETDRVEMWDDVAKKRKTRAFTQAEINAGLAS